MGCSWMASYYVPRGSPRNALSLLTSTALPSGSDSVPPSFLHRAVEFTVW